MGLVAAYRLLLGPASCVVMRVPAEHVSKRLVRDDHAGEQRSARGLLVKITEDVVG